MELIKNSKFLYVTIYQNKWSKQDYSREIDLIQKVSKNTVQSTKRSVEVSNDDVNRVKKPDASDKIS